MSLISDNIIPGPRGRVFGTDAVHKSDLESIKERILRLDGVKAVTINTDVFPRELTVFVSKLLSVEELENSVKKTGFHAIPTKDFEV
ncbi:heavy-metal-associated domain-containing protein [Winogradskyella alexanderae]|uniref:Heavy-metal-associated domain-containing protein n=1 Tax=Winogradskyella alexanderae TaxID=2877123 RepID=A0ABS7XT96_9FLAO|nr:heavy metal-associated domain-containing protein [Winogradskyella alexanderae]MCA0133250.1 heavy-metal-associated domain-containing protein [Winogradskyella alexanderae]